MIVKLYVNIEFFRFQLRPTTCSSDYEKQYAEFTTNEIDEFHPIENTIYYQAEQIPTDKV